MTCLWYEWLRRNEYLLRLHGYIVRYCRKSHATMSKGRRLWSLHSLSPPPPLVDTPLRLKTYWRIRKLLQVKNALTGKEELGKEIYKRQRNVHLIRGKKPCEKSFVLAGTLPFVGLDLVVEKYSTLYCAWHLAPPVYFTCLFKAQGQLVCKLAYASDVS